MQTHTWDADSVFQDVDPFLGVEVSHLFQSLKAGSHIQIILVTQPVCEGAYALFFEHPLTRLPFFTCENVLTL